MYQIDTLTTPFETKCLSELDSTRVLCLSENKEQFGPSFLGSTGVIGSGISSPL
jgi:hypothetical protein